MAKSILLIVLMFVSATTLSQKKVSYDTISYKYRIDSVYSNSLKERRFIKIYLPKGFREDIKYPVFFVLDENWMFEPTIVYLKQLVAANIVPPSIVVGVQSNNRSKDLRLDLNGDFTESSKAFYKYITSDLINYITKNLSKPAFSILIGHSDAAVFSEKVLTQVNQPFRAILSLSVQLAPGQFNEIKTFSTQHFSNCLYHFVASGTKDASRRLQSALKLDSFFKTVNNPDLHLKAEIYNTDHFGVAIRSLIDGISFVFGDYQQPNDWNEAYLDSLRQLNANPVDVIKNYLRRIDSIYHIDAQPTEDGLLSVGFAILKNKKQVEDYWDYVTKLKGRDQNFNAAVAQSFELIKDYTDALKYWELNLTDANSFSGAFFYYNRPLELLAYKMNKPLDALKFAEKWKQEKPEYTLDFNYAIAKICAEKNIEKSKGKQAIQYCIQNYKDNRFFTIEDARLISGKLNK